MQAQNSFWPINLSQQQLLQHLPQQLLQLVSAAQNSTPKLSWQAEAPAGITPGCFGGLLIIIQGVNSPSRLLGFVFQAFPCPSMTEAMYKSLCQLLCGIWMLMNEPGHVNPFGLHVFMWKWMSQSLFPEKCGKVAAENNKGIESFRRIDYDKDMSAEVMKVASATSQGAHQRRIKAPKLPPGTNQRPKGAKNGLSVTEEAVTEVVPIGQHHNIVVDQHNLSESVGIISDGGNNENDDTLALVAFHAPTIQQHKVVEHKVGEVVMKDQEVEEVHNGQASEFSMVISDSGLPEQYATKWGEEMYEDHDLCLTIVGGQYHCKQLGGKTFQNPEEFVKFAEENGYVLHEDSTISSETGYEVPKVIQNSANESCHQVDDVDPSPIPRTHHRKKGVSVFS
ncbi:hypothetical protein QQ045_007923 [Rhodiola kirilowii]